MIGLEDEIQASAKAVVDGCKHTFCLKCIREWIEFKPEQPVCPLCKRAITGYTHGYGKLAQPSTTMQGAGTADQPYEFVEWSQGAGASSTEHPPDEQDRTAGPSGSGGEEFCVEHTEVRPRPPRLPSLFAAGHPLAGDVLGIPVASLFNDSEMAILNEVFGFAMQANMCTCVVTMVKCWVHITCPPPITVPPFFGPMDLAPPRQPRGARAPRRQPGAARRTQQARANNAARGGAAGANNPPAPRSRRGLSTSSPAAPSVPRRTSTRPIRRRFTFQQ